MLFWIDVSDIYLSLERPVCCHEILTFRSPVALQMPIKFHGLTDLNICNKLLDVVTMKYGDIHSDGG